MNNRQVTHFPEAIRTMVTVNQSGLTASDEVGEYESGWVHQVPSQGQRPKAGSGGGVPGAGGGRRIGVWWLGDTCKVRSVGPHHAVPGRLRMQVDLDSKCQRVTGKV